MQSCVVCKLKRGHGCGCVSAWVGEEGMLNEKMREWENGRESGCGGE